MNTTLVRASKNVAPLKGERLEDAQVATIMQQCSPPEDEDGFIDYERNAFFFLPKLSLVRRTTFDGRCSFVAAFVKKLMAGPFPHEQ